MKAWTWAMLLTIAPGCAATVDRPVALASGRVATATAAAQAAADRSDPLTLDVFPRVAWSQADVWVHLRIPPDPRSRTAEIAWLSDAGGGAHLITLEGERAARHHQFALKRLEPGEYEVEVVLTRSDGSRVRRATTVLISH
jgi:hypothetical protein